MTVIPFRSQQKWKKYVLELDDETRIKGKIRLKNNKGIC
jgi:hypothetical protein